MADKKEPFNQRQYEREYHREMYYRVTMFLSRKYDKDVISHLQSQKSKSDYLKKLVRADMHKHDVPGDDWPE